MTERITSFEEFWPYYVRQHAKPLTRRLHYLGTTAAIACIATFGRTRRPRYLALAALAGYGPAWISHFFVEKNRPATFQYPLWSLLADFRMFERMSRGTMDAEVSRVMAMEPPRTNGSDASEAHVASTHANAN